MRITVVAGQFPAMSETFVLSQVASLLELGHEVRVVATRQGDGPHHSILGEDDLARLVQYRPRRGSLRGLARSLGALVRQPRGILRTLNVRRLGMRALSLRLAYSSVPWLSVPNPDAVICHFGHNAMVVSDLRDAGVFSAPLAVIFHGSDVFPSTPSKYEELFRRAEVIVTVNHEFAERLLRLGAPPDRTRVLHMGADLRRFRFRGSRSVNADRVRIVTVARLVEIKGVDVTLRAIASLPTEIRRRVHYEVVGDGPLRAELEGLARVLDVAEQVDFVGALEQDEVAEHLGGADLFVLPSRVMKDGRGEGKPVALMEAMAAGVPAIGSRSGGIPELIEHRRTGLLFDADDHEALAHEITWAVSHPAQIAAMTAAAREYVAKEHDTLTQTRRLLALLANRGRSNPGESVV